MKIIKPVLLGPKLIAVGPLKCFKGGDGGSGGGGGGGGGGGKGGGGSRGTQGAQARESRELAKQMKKEEEDRVKKETSMGGQLAGMDFSDIKRDPVTGKQTGKVKKKDDRTGLQKVGGFLKGLAGGTFSTDKDEQDAAFNKAEAANLSKRAGRTVSVEEMKEFEEQGGGTFGGPSAKEFFGQKDRAAAEGVKDFIFTDQAEVARLEAEEKAAADFQKARELEAEQSSFGRQLRDEGFDFQKAIADRAEGERLRTETSGAQLTDLGRQGALQKAIEDRQDMREMGFDENIIDSRLSFEEKLARQSDIDDKREDEKTLQRELTRRASDRRLDAEADRELAIQDRRARAIGEDLTQARQAEQDFFDKERDQRTLSRELARRRSDRALAKEADREALEREQSSFGRQLREEGFDFQKAIEDRELSEDLRREDLRRRKRAETERLIEADAPDQVGIREALADRELQEQIAADPRFGSEEEFEAFKDAQEEKTPEEIAEDQRRVEELYVASQNRKRDRMALMDYEKGLITAQEYGALTGNEKIPRKSLLTRRNFIEALGLYPKGGAAVKNIAKFLNKKLAKPTTMEEAEEDIASEAEKKEAKKETGKKTDSKKPLNVTTRSGGDRSEQKPATPVAPAPPVAAPAPAPTPKPVEQLTADEVGDSIVKKEAQLIRERTLAQQLASIRGLRGATAGQKARLLRRSQERFDREFAPQVQLAVLKERETRRKEQQGLSEAEKDRQNALERQKLASGKLVSLPGSSKPSWLQGLEAVSDALPVIEDVATGLGDFLTASEGGFVSGKGTETSDSIPARLSDGEFVIKASAVRGIGKSMGAKGKKQERKKGVDFLYKLQDRMGKVEKFSEGGEAYSRPKKAFREAIGYKPESRFHDKAFKDTKHGGARRKFRHFQMGGAVDMKGPGMVKDQFKAPTSGYGAVVSAQGDLMRRIEELERKVGK